jgi:hypothetical protein
MKNLMLLSMCFLMVVQAYAQTEYSFELPVEKTFDRNQEIAIFKGNILIGKIGLGKNITFMGYEIKEDGKNYLLQSDNGDFIAKTNCSFTKIWNKKGDIIARRKLYGGNKVVWENIDNSTIISTSEMNKGKISASVYLNNDTPEYALIALLERLKSSKDVLISNFSFVI